MNDFNSKVDALSKAIAFLDVAILEEGKAFRGGILVTDINTYPLEFRITTPIRPTPLQTILYGRILKDYIYTELVAIPLLKGIRSKPEFVFVISEQLLNVRSKIHLPIFYIDEKNGEFKIKTHPKYKSELQAARPTLMKLDRSLLLEAFSRVQAALQEAHKQHVGETNNK